MKKQTKTPKRPLRGAAKIAKHKAQAKAAAAPKTKVPAARPLAIVVSPRAEDRLVVLAPACPKRPGSTAAKMWACYQNAKTVGDYQTAVRALRGVRKTRARTSLRWDQKHGYVRVEPAPKTGSDASTAS